MKFKNTRFIVIALILLIFRLSISIAITDSNPSNNVKNVTINVVATIPLKIYYIGMDNPNDVNGIISESNRFVNKTYPIADDDLKFKRQEKFLDSSSTIFAPSYEGTLWRLYWRGLLSGFYPTHSVGIVPINWFDTHFENKTWDGLAYVDSKITGVIVEEGQRHSVAHEIAHSYGLCEEYNTAKWEEQNNNTNCTNAKLNATMWEASCFDEKTGCDAITIGRLTPWNNSNDTITLFNFMGSSDNENSRWVSNETYSILLNQLRVTNKIVSNSTILVTGYIHKNGSSEIFNSYILGEANITTQNDLIIGNNSLEVLDASNNVISNLSFQPSYTIGFDNGNISQSNFSFFAFIMNFSQSLNKIQLKQNVTILSQRNRTANAPSLNLTFPIGNELLHNKMNITYNSTDADGDTINYAVLVSSDNGNTYSTLEIDYINKTLFVNTSGFTESKEYKVKILATDGINTNTTISQGTFEIDNDLRITNLSTRLENDTRRVFFHKTKNTLENRINNITETFDTGESVISLSQNYSLNGTQEMFVFIEYNYTSRGYKTIIASSFLIKNIGGL